MRTTAVGRNVSQRTGHKQTEGGLALSGNEAAALAIKQVCPDVVSAYPITPQTDIVQYLAQFVADGTLDSEFLRVESEHSAMSSAIGARAAGARVATASSSQGLAYMWETLHIAAGMRLPILMVVVNRALSSPLNIHCDHSDSMGARDTGWIQLYASDVQEAYDNVIQAVRIAEDPDVLLPVMVCMDGFLVSHSLENLRVLPNEAVQSFVGVADSSRGLLHRAVTYGALDLQDYYYEHRRQLAYAMEKAKSVILRVGHEYEALTGRAYSFFQAYRMKDAEVAIVVMGSVSGTVRVAVDEQRAEGIKAGMISLRVFRPFPSEKLAATLAPCKRIAVLDRADTLSTSGGPLFLEIRSALYPFRQHPEVRNYIYGLGGRDVSLEDIRRVFKEITDETPRRDTEHRRNTDRSEEIVYLGVRG